LPKSKPKEETGMNKSRPKHGEKGCPEDAWKEWEWIRYPGDESHTEEPKYRAIREETEYRAERETDRDLEKSIPQLVADFNTVVEHLIEDRGKEDKEGLGIRGDTIYLLAAQSRMVAMMAQVAMKHIDISESIVELNRHIDKLTKVLIIITIVLGTLALLLPFREDLFKCLLIILHNIT
jgi:hypothetical protein